MQCVEVSAHSLHRLLCLQILAVTDTMSGNETDVHLRKMYPLAQFIIKAPIVKISGRSQRHLSKYSALEINAI